MAVPDVLVHPAGELRPQPASRHAFEAVHRGGHGDLRRVLHQQVLVVFFAVEFLQFRVERAAPVFRYEDLIDVHGGNCVPAVAVSTGVCHRPAVASGVVQVRYRYRLYPSPGQQQAPARAFGCARVVYNDCLLVRDKAHEAGEKISDTEVQRQVITLAKATPERAWLGEVASVALVQACQDARRAYRNWFDSLSGQRKGPKVRHPKPRCKRGRQSIRLTRNGFALHGAWLYVAKIGDIRVAWSRDLPSVPSSVTVIREPDGRYYASFVVEREATPLPVCGREAGIDLGLAKSVHDAGWSLLLRLVKEKAAHYGRTFAKVGRFEPTSQVCSACGVKDGPKPLAVRQWTCAACGTTHDRDVNAARNILAAGRADRLNARGGDVRPGHLLAVAAEAGTHRSAV
jgi:transposase